MQSRRTLCLTNIIGMLETEVLMISNSKLKYQSLQCWRGMEVWYDDGMAMKI